MKRIITFIVLALAVTACSSSDRRFQKTPVDELIKTMDKKDNFTIVLYDMDLEEHTFSSDIYRHKYKVVTLEENAADSTVTPKSIETEWYEVPEWYFDDHVNDMGMEIAAKQDGKVTKQVAPAGYSQYVGNSKYGRWETNSSGESFWSFYGKYAMMRSLFGMTFYQPVYRSYYTDYSRYRTAGRPYYGTTTVGVTKTSRYGTFSAASKSSSMANRSFTSKLSSNSSFRNKVNRSVSRSPSSVAAGTRSKTSRSSSRYGSSSSSSSRSRSSGRGGK
ncbi:membrane lipoprotein lipid attachment site-containing protein [Limibacter armeniacum]|uniref:membrane lipoprotein lipid attachment site-containing protein n=1 Tax=Limibacter armeniacum TaxID=466084 RepID=UPI002FE55D3B